MWGIRIQAARGLDGLNVVELPDPGAPGPGEIRVRVRASSLNFHDYAVCRSGDPKFDGRIPLADGAGTVEAVGEGVSEFAVGDAVVSTFFPLWLDGPPVIANFSTTPGDGVDGYAREVVVRSATGFTHAPKGWSPAEAATLTTAGVTAWRALVADGGLKAGDSVLALGTGGVSIFALQIAKAMGATVIVTSSSDEKLKRARALGADHTINYKAEPRWSEAVLALTGGRGVDHVVDVVGPGALPQSIAATRVGGHIALIGVLTGRSGEIPTGLMMSRQVRLQGLIVGSRRHQADMVRDMEARGLRPVIDRTFALAELGEAFRYEESGAHFGKIAIDLEA
jgi:NADPH:quinone reductase-like Zn-dependent oxidoreductase